jgi:hypothetical protein
MHDIQARKHLSIPAQPPQFRRVELSDGTTVMSCACGWQIKVRLYDPSVDMSLTLAAERHVCADASSPRDLVDAAIAAIRDLNDRFLPSHTREHALEALDLLRVVREELDDPNADESPCRRKVS